jgi:hypothetical protein
MFGAAVRVARPSDIHCRHPNGDAENAVVGACQSSAPPSAWVSKKVNLMSWYSGNHEQPVSAGETPTRARSAHAQLARPRRKHLLASTASGDSAAVRGVPVEPAVPCSVATSPRSLGARKVVDR